jgi:hypothetical protein
MEIKTLTCEAFKKYGAVLEGYDFSALIGALNSGSERPDDSVIYVPGDPSLEALEISSRLRDGVYGGMPIQVGYCNGYNRRLNCLEYHRGSEVNVAADDVVLLLAPLQSVCGGKLDTSVVEAFAVPAGTGVVLYETTLHYAPCRAPGGGAFRVAIILPRGTNTEKPALEPQNGEDRLLWARNKWLIAHPDAPEAAMGAFAGLEGDNISV